MAVLDLLGKGIHQRLQFPLGAARITTTQVEGVLAATQFHVHAGTLLECVVDVEGTLYVLGTHQEGGLLQVIFRVGGILPDQPAVEFGSLAVPPRRLVQLGEKCGVYVARPQVVGRAHSRYGRIRGARRVPQPRQLKPRGVVFGLLLHDRLEHRDRVVGLAQQGFPLRLNEALLPFHLLLAHLRLGGYQDIAQQKQGQK